MSDLERLKKDFAKEHKNQKIVLAGAVLVLIASFLPWTSVDMGMFGGVSVNGWHSWGLLSVLSSLALILLWLLPRLGVKLDFVQDEGIVIKIASIVMLAGAVLWLLVSDFMFSILGFGFWLGLLGGILAVIFAFMRK